MHARPDGSLPPSPRWWADDPYPVARRAAGLGCGERQMLDRRRQELVDRLDELDAVVARVDARCGARRSTRPRTSTTPCGRPSNRAGAGAHLAPVARRWLRRSSRRGRCRGAVLRSVCMALLQLHDELALVELHTLLHVYGYEIASRTPVKSLADSMRYEVLEGRASRPGEGSTGCSVRRRRVTSTLG